MPFMFMPFIPSAGAAAPMPATGKSIATEPACSKVSVILTRLAFDQRALQIGEHQVIAAGRQLDRAVGGNGESVFHLAHRHHAALHAHLVDFDLGEIGRSASQRVGGRAGVADFEIGGADVRALGRRARPWPRDRQIAGFDLLCAGRRRAEAEHECEADGEELKSVIVRLSKKDEECRAPFTASR